MGTGNWWYWRLWSAFPSQDLTSSDLEGVGTFVGVIWLADVLWARPFSSWGLLQARFDVEPLASR
jgi:hypothetical protein